MKKIKPRVRTAKLIQANSGLRVQFAKQLEKVLKAYRASYVKKAIEIYKEAQAFEKSMQYTTDALLPSKRRLEKLIKQAREAIENTNEDARDISYRFVNKLVIQLTSQQKRALRNAGLSERTLKEAFSIPTINGQFIAPRVSRKIPAYIDYITGLITNIEEDIREQIDSTLERSLDKGYNINDFQKELRSYDGFDRERAKRVALDQSVKLNQFIQIENCKDAGIEEAIWYHVPGLYTSRETHIHMNGKKFNLTVGMYDPAVGRNVQCGELPFCRCIFKPIIPMSEYKK